MGSTPYKIYDNTHPYFMTSSFVRGYPLFADPDVAQIVLDSLVFMQNKREITLYSYVLMENHFHTVAQGDNLSEQMRRFKSYTAREIINLFDRKKRTWFLRQLKAAKPRYKIESTFQIWQESFHPKKVIGDDMMIQKIEYIHQNPVKCGYVDHPRDWRYSSARNYAGEKALISVTLYER